MAERVIFEYRAGEPPGNAEQDCCFASGPCFGPSVWAFCRAMGDAERPPSGRSKPSRPSGDGPQPRMRETLYFLERLYDDLYGEN
jgi:hypothetical protein